MQRRVDVAERVAVLFLLLEPERERKQLGARVERLVPDRGGQGGGQAGQSEDRGAQGGGERGDNGGGASCRTAGGDGGGASSDGGRSVVAALLSRSDALTMRRRAVATTMRVPWVW